MAAGEEAGQVPSVTPGFSSVQQRGDASGVVANEAAGDWSQPASWPVKDESREAVGYCTPCLASPCAGFEARPVCSSGKRLMHPNLRASCRTWDSCGLVKVKLISRVYY